VRTKQHQLAPITLEIARRYPKTPSATDILYSFVGTAEGIDRCSGTDLRMLLMNPVSPCIPKSMLPRRYLRTIGETDIYYDLEGTAEGIDRSSESVFRKLMRPMPPRIPTLPPPVTPVTWSATTPDLPPAPPRAPKNEFSPSGDEFRLLILWSGQTGDGLNPLACPGHYIGQSCTGVNPLACPGHYIGQ
jgi:hypothetical protein